MKIDRSKRTEFVSEEGRAKQVRRILEGYKADSVKECDLSIREVVKEQQGPRM
jgi:hypothetical protein